MNYDHEIIDLNIRKHRLRTNIGVSEYVGSIVAAQTHESNKRPMYRMYFGKVKHDALWGHTWFYFDDLEVAV